MKAKGTVLYIGGFELPDKNAAAQRVVGIAKGLRELQYEVVFLNSVKNKDNKVISEKEYFGLKCYEYGRESDKDYLFTGKTTLSYIDKISPDIVIAYNYPGIALERIRRNCKKMKIKCFADATEWYQVRTGNFVYRVIKTFDTYYRMRFVQKKLDGVIAISRFLFDYYNSSVNTVLIPPTVDISDEKWNIDVSKDDSAVSFIYAGSPSAQKERIDLIVESINNLNLNKHVRLNIVGITREQFINIYNWKKDITDRVIFWGRIDHNEVIKLTKRSDWAIIIRDNNFVVNAGFPTKLVESISSGTPVIINRFSNVEDYLNNDNSILIKDSSSIVSAIAKANKTTHSIDRNIFSYMNYLNEIRELLEAK